MAVKKVLENSGHFTGILKRLRGPSGARVKSAVLCECNEEYEIEEKFDFLNGSSSRGTECPNCHDKTYVSYGIKTKEEGDFLETRYTLYVEIGSKATAIRHKTQKQEEIDIELLYK